MGPRREEGGRLKRVGQKGEGGRELDMMGRELGKEGDEGERIFEWYFYQNPGYSIFFLKEVL